MIRDVKYVPKASGMTNLIQNIVINLGNNLVMPLSILIDLLYLIPNKLPVCPQKKSK